MRNVQCHGCRLYGHYKAVCPSGGSQQPDMRLCHNCHQSGHLSRNCTRPRDNGHQIGGRQQQYGGGERHQQQQKEL